MALTPKEARMARAALHLTVRQVADKVGLAANTVSAFENSGGGYATTVEKLEAFYRTAGIRFPSKDIVDASAAQEQPRPRKPRRPKGRKTAKPE